MHYRETGRGKPVVFIHGAAGSGQLFANQYQAFRETHRGYFLDLPGHGRSASTAHPGIPGYAAAVIEFLDSLDEPAVVCGHSMGGAVAIDVALARPDALCGLVLAGTGCRMPVSDRILAGLGSDYEATLDAIARYCFSKTVDPELLGRARAEMGRCPPEVTCADFAACNEFDRCDAVSGIELPVQIICGTKDVMTPPASSEQLRDSIADSSLAGIPDGSHMVMLEQPSSFNAVLAGFLVLI